MSSKILLSLAFQSRYFIQFQFFFFIIPRIPFNFKFNKIISTLLLYFRAFLIFNSTSTFVQPERGRFFLFLSTT